MVYYEWVVELIEDTYGDIVDLTHADTYAAAKKSALDYTSTLKKGYTVAIGLVRNSGDEIDGIQDRQWAYIGWLEDGELPPLFDGGAKVPKRFINEVARGKA